MESFFFQTNERSNTARLNQVKLDAPMDTSVCYGVFHEPSGDLMTDHAVLFLYPWGQEYVRSHRAIRRLALNLQSQGVASFRFDYRGTGDSGGDAHGFSLETAQQDALSALAYLEELTGVDQVKICGVRLGCLIGFEALAAHPLVKEIHCWDPVLNGADYLAQLRGPSITSRLEQSGTTWINGYPLNSALIEGLASSASLDTNSMTRASSTRAIAPTFFYGAGKTPNFLSWCEAHSNAGTSVQQHHCHDDLSNAEWGSVDVVGGFISPHDILRTMEEELKRAITIA